MATAILIAGMHRSGTSAAAGALQLLGVSLGRDLLAAGVDNPKGYFENERAVQIHERLLQRMGSSWDDVRPLPSGWAAGDAAGEARESIRRLIKDEFAGHRLWAIKDPRICRFIPLWQSVLEELGIQAVSLMVARGPVEVAASIAKRNGWARPLGELLWMRHVFEAEAATRDMTRTVITYEQLLRDPHGCLRNAMGRLQLEVPEATTSAGDIADFVDPGYRHHVDTQSASDAFQKLMEDAYRELASIEAGMDRWGRVRDIGIEAAALVSSWIPYIDAVADKAARHQAELRDMEISRFQVQSELNAQISWSEEAVVRERDLHERLEASASRQQELVAQGEALEARCAQLLDARVVLEGQNEQLRREQAELSQMHGQLLREQAELSQMHGQLLREQAELSRLHDQLLREQAELQDVCQGLAGSLAALEQAHEKLEDDLAQQVIRNETLSEKNARSEVAIHGLEEAMHRLSAEKQELDEKAMSLSLELDQMVRSRSWRWTRPLRAIADLFRS